jgi:protein-S-isoprenylcysteine O-methyltransferase Ste14
MLLLFSILIINSSVFSAFFKENLSYFGNLWTWFTVLGILLLVSGVRIMQLANRLLGKNKKIYSTEKIFKIMRFPKYSALFLIYYGLAILLDSFIGILFIPLFIVLLEIIVNLEEKKVLLKKYKKSYENYMQKTPAKLFPNPYNYVIIIITVLIFYIGFFKFFM